MTYEVLEREYIITKSATRAGLPPLPEDPKEALAWMRSGVKNDDSRATFELAQAYQYGKCGISINAMNQRWNVGFGVRGAATAFARRRGVDRGRARRLPPERPRATSSSLSRPSGAPPSRQNARTPSQMKTAVKLYKRAVELGSTDSMVQLGFFYEFGRKPARLDKQKALALYKKAADRGDPNGQFYYARTVCPDLTKYTLADAMRRDPKMLEAAHYYELAADQGDGDGAAATQCGICLQLVNGFTHFGAIRMFMRASWKGDRTAMKLLAGEVVNLSLPLFAYWFKGWLAAIVMVLLCEFDTGYVLKLWWRFGRWIKGEPPRDPETNTYEVES